MYIDALAPNFFEPIFPVHTKRSVFSKSLGMVQSFKVDRARARSVLKSDTELRTRS